MIDTCMHTVPENSLQLPQGIVLLQSISQLTDFRVNGTKKNDPERESEHEVWNTVQCAALFRR